MGYSVFAAIAILSLAVSVCNGRLAAGHPTPTYWKFLECLEHESRHPTNISAFVYSHGSPHYSSTLQSSIQNLRFLDKKVPKPIYIIQPPSPNLIQATIICARQHNLDVRTRSGGHDYEGLSYTTTKPFLLDLHFVWTRPFVLLDLANYRDITVNVEERTAWVQAGATIGELYYHIAKSSPTLGFPSGTCHTVGVGGQFSGGGQGALHRKYGLASDNVIDAILVTANGTILDRESMGEDLFWALRGGGGGNFGVTAAWKVKLVKVPPIVTTFVVARTLEQNATELVHKWQHIAHSLDRDLFIRLLILPSKNTSGKKTILVLLQSLYLGTAEQLTRTMKSSFPELGLNAKDIAQTSWIESVLQFGEEIQGQPHEALLNQSLVNKGFFKSKSDFVRTPISKKGLEALWKTFLGNEEPGMMVWEPYGGKMSEIGEHETPFPHRAGTLYNIQYFSKWFNQSAEIEEKRLQWINLVYKFMEPYVTKHPRTAYVNYRDLDLGRNGFWKVGGYKEAKVWGTKYFKHNFKRLALIKAKVDPDNFFWNEQSIPPFTLSSH
ncbi:hypothetical protein Ancab_019124 [Ancistrocladus abbreviatus]